MNKTINPLMLKKIKSFWKWFEENEPQITIIVTERKPNVEVLKDFNRKLGYVSKRIGFLLIGKKQLADKSKIIFTSDGYRKLFPKINALIENAPRFERWTFQSLIQPCTDLEKYKNRTDNAYKFPDFELKISDMYFKPLDYNTTTKRMKIEVYIDNYKYHYDNPFMGEAIRIILLDLVGEINFKKSIHFIQLEQLPDNPKNLVHLYELNEHIEFLQKVNRRVKIEV